MQVSEPGIPALQLQVNGHEGKFYLHPKLSNDIDDAWAAFDPHNSVDLLQIPIPASYLRIGEDQIVISYVNQPLPNQEAARPSAVPAAPSPNLPANPFNPAAGYSSLRYDAISLENDPLHP